MRDLTDYKELENQRLQTEKLGSLGVLAGGIAHDFNNMLTGVISALSLIQRISDDELVKKWAEQAERASDKAKDLTQQLLTFSKGGLPVKKYFNIEHLLRESVEFTLRGANVSAEILVNADKKIVYADEGQISQVMNNLLINAMQAMPDGGNIRIEAENETISTELLKLNKGKYVVIKIKDEGKGIPYEDLTRIFDPYFTTKKDGSGLGLATAYSIIKNHSGSISADSIPGKGTEFTVYLPISEHAPDPEKAGDVDLDRKREGKILIMDDELMILNSLKEILQRSGFIVEVSLNGDDAVRKYRNAFLDGIGYDLVIFDLTVPGSMGGREAIQLMKEINPDIKAIVSSGYSSDPVISKFEEFGFAGIVPKPYNMKELIAEIDRVMSE